jgi:hypothetical protein
MRTSASRHADPRLRVTILRVLALPAALLAMTTATGCNGVVAVQPPSTQPACGDWAHCSLGRHVARIVKHAGFRVAGNTGSALIAGTKGSRFLIWAAPATAVNRVGKPFGEACGIQVRHERRRRFWHTNDHTFWVEPGPQAGSHLPRWRDFARLVCATTSI